MRTEVKAKEEKSGLTTWHLRCLLNILVWMSVKPGQLERWAQWRIRAGDGNKREKYLGLGERERDA